MMGSDQHTPGPWFVAGVRFRMNGGEWHGIHRYDEAKKQDENIAAVGYDPRTGAGWADAQLIASAPTMAARITELEAALSAATAERDEWHRIGDDDTYPPHEVPVLLWSPPTMGHPDGLMEARPFSTGRSGDGWSERSQHGYATHWRPLPPNPKESANG